MASPSPPQFFRIVLKSSLQDKRLKIPEKFVRDYGEFLSSPVCFKLPNDEKWEIGLTTVNGMIWFHNGWSEFAEYYSLEFGSLLVFRYDSDSTFLTNIFDMTGLEIKYPCENSQESKSIHDDDLKDDDDDDDDESVVVLDNFPPYLTKREKASPDSQQPCKKMRNEDSNGPNMETKGDNVVKESGGSKLNSVKRSEDHRARQPFSKLERDEEASLTASEEDDILCAREENSTHGQAKKYMSAETETKARANVKIKAEVTNDIDINGKVKKPFSSNQTSTRKGNAGIPTSSGIRQKLNGLNRTPSCSVTMLRSYVKRCNLNLPSRFIKKHWTDSNLTYCDVALETSDGRKWPAKLYSTGGISQPKFEICYGWRKFTLDNDLKEGDVCFFEMKKIENKFVFNVTIFRLFDDEDEDEHEHEHENKPSQANIRKRRFPQKASPPRNLKTSEPVIKHKPKNPFFEVSMPNSKYTRVVLNIPGSFSRENLSIKMQSAKLKVGDKGWKVTLKQYDRCYRFSAGWCSFWRENSLRVGDRCLFEMVKKKKLKCVFKVSIIRK